MRITSTWIDDANGNMLTDEQGREYLADARNRLTTFYRNEALERRNRVLHDQSSSMAADLSTSAWQMIDERENRGRESLLTYNVYIY